MALIVRLLRRGFHIGMIGGGIGRHFIELTNAIIFFY